MHAKFRLSPIARSLPLAILPLAAAAHAAPDSAAVELPPVVVSADAARQEGRAEQGYRTDRATLGPLGSTTLLETPFSLNVTSGELFEHRGAHTVSEALKTNPAVATLMESSGYTSMSRVMIRGFTAADQNDMRDGLVDRSFAFVPLENVERIEVLNGLSGFLYGFSAPGGTINYVSKQPTTTPYAALAGGQYGGGIHYLHGDLGGLAGKDDRWGYRVNVYGEDGGSHIDGNRQRRQLVSAVVTFKPTSGTTLQADIWHQDLTMKGLATYLNPLVAGGMSMVPDASRFDARTQYGQDWSYNRANKTLLGVGIDSTLNDTFSVRAAYRYGTMWRDYLYVSGTLLDAAGNTYSQRAIGSTRQHEDTYAAYALIDASFRTGPVIHKVTAGYTSTNYLYDRGDDVFSTLGVSSTQHPASYARPEMAVGPTNVWYRQYARNWVLGDQITFNDDWSLLAGVTHANLELRRWGPGTALAAANYNQSKVTPSAALMYKPSSSLTVYASYMQGLANGGTAPGTAKNAGQILPPSVSEQFEWGAKARIAGVDLSAAWFHIDKVNEYLDPGDNSYKQDGREIHRGWEFLATGKLTSRLTVVGGLTVQDAHIGRARNTPALQGKAPVNVPERMARLYLEYALADVPGLILTGGAYYSGRRAVDGLNTGYLDGATTYDLGARYLTRLAGHKLTMTGNISNVLDKAYWSYYRAGDGLLPGAPRAVSLTAKLEW